MPAGAAVITDSLPMVKISGLSDTNATPTEALQTAIRANLSDTVAAQTEALTARISGLTDMNSAQGEMVGAVYKYRTAGAGSFTAPKDGNYQFTLWGGGGGGAAGSATNGGTGGTSGDRVVTTMTLTNGQVVPFSVAAASATAGIGNNTTVTLPGGSTINTLSLADSSSNGRNLTKTGTVDPTTSPSAGFNGAAQLTTGSSNLTLPIAQGGVFDPRGGRARTYEIRIITPASPVATALMGQWSGNALPGVADWLVHADAQGRLAIAFGNAAGGVDVFTGPVMDNSASVVISADSQQRLFLNGTLVLTGTGSISANASATEFAINKAVGYSSQSYVADEVRVSDIIRYTSTYTPATTPFANDANTLALYHLDTVQTPVGSSIIAKGGANATASTGGTITPGNAGAAGALLGAGGKGGDAPGGGTGGNGNTGAGSPGNAPGGGGGGGGGSLTSPGAGSTGASGGIDIQVQLV